MTFLLHHLSPRLTTVLENTTSYHCRRIWVRPDQPGDAQVHSEPAIYSAKELKKGKAEKRKIQTRWCERITKPKEQLEGHFQRPTANDPDPRGKKPPGCGKNDAQVGY